jgi:hypothetical protein
VGGFPCPAIALSADRFAMVMDDAMGVHLVPYANTVNFLLVSYVLPHVTAAASMGSAPRSWATSPNGFVTHTS